MRRILSQRLKRGIRITITNVKCSLVRELVLSACCRSRGSAITIYGRLFLV